MRCSCAASPRKTSRARRGARRTSSRPSRACGGRRSPTPGKAMRARTSSEKGSDPFLEKGVTFLLDARAGDLHHLGPAGELLLQVGVELGGSVAHRVGALLLERIANHGVFRRL